MPSALPARGDSAASDDSGTPAPDVSIVILNYNGRAHLPRCLSAVDATRSPTLQVEVILVDNGSVDASVAFVREHYPGIRLIELPANEGFAGGNNRGATAARGRWLAFLNNDTEVCPRWLEELTRAVTSAPDAALATACLVYLDDPETVDSAGDALTRAGGAFKRGHGEPVADWQRAGEVFAACGAACLVSRAVFEEVGGFDEDFFLSHEDVDLSYRVRLRGYRCLYVPTAVVRHVGSATLGRASARAIRYGQRNLEWLYLKNTPATLLVRTAVPHLIYVVAAAVYFTLNGQLPAFVSAKWAALCGVPRMWAKRRDVQRMRTIGPTDLWPVLEPSWLGVKLREKRFDRRQSANPRAPHPRGPESTGGSG